ncbi:MAG: 2-alkenal reductase [Candidatus Entotheonella factor]|uniref:2-alkenal reductase n=1 Tax=Entotheonella factor TaxID=1429438 RepID=W4LUP6_ENTF1|nr:trypsin-like peptidase domain-containing protein [Candidatus Entotheonella palauensis]ETX01764.1 MAG: 2-alkenal reductase [Candidatus Entotheonella factor]
MLKLSKRGRLIGVLLLGLLLLSAARHRQRPHDLNAAPRPITPRGRLAADERATIQLFQNTSPSVVYITTLRRDFFNLNMFDIPQGSGSGFVWDQNGHIITNYHVIQNASRAQVTLADQSVWEAQRVGVAPSKDLAVLFIQAPRNQLKPLALGTSHDLQVGQNVYAIGNPFGLDQTLTTGIISALGREISTTDDRTITGVIQTDAAINPGNSGGPLLDSAGRLIGVNTAIYSSSGSSAGIGFAVPVDTVNRVVPQLIRYGRIIRPGLGIQPLDDATARHHDLPGVLILQIERGSAAHTAGLRGTWLDRRGRTVYGDIIVGIDAKPVRTTNDLLNILETHKAGETVTVEIIREDKRFRVPVTLQHIQ